MEIRTNLLILLVAVLWPGQTILAQPARQLQPYVAQNKLYALHKPADWKVAETVQPNFFRVLVSSPDATSAVDFAWLRNDQARSNAVRYLASYRQFLARTYPDVTFTGVHGSRDNLRGVATVSFRVGGTLVRGRYYFESNPRQLSAQGYFAPENLLASRRALLVNIMASLAFVKKDDRPAASGPEPRYYRPPMVVRTAEDRSLSVKVPTDWKFLAAGGKVVTGAPGGPGFLFTSFQGNPMLPGAPITQGIIGSRYLPPPQTLAWILQGFQHRDVRIESARPDVRSSQELAMRIRRQGDAQDVTAHWKSANGGVPSVGVFKVINIPPSMTGLWSTIVGGIWAPENDAQRYLPVLEEVASSFSINDEYAREYIRQGLERLRALQRQTNAAIRDLNSAREQNQRDWEERQRRKEFSDSKWDDYRRGHSYWVSDLEGGKVYATDNWGTRDTATGDYYEGRAYNWTNFEGENPRYPESMREISSYELQQMSGQRP